jgi:hypothetical protein
MRGRSATAVAVCVAITACLIQPSRPSFNDEAIETACTDRANAVCALRMQCSAISDGVDYTNQHTYGGDAECVTRGIIECTDLFHVRDNNLTLADEMACATAITDGDTCSDFFDGIAPPRCQPPAGPGALGSPCALEQQCQTGFCAIAAGHNCGTCQSLPGSGSVCNVNGQCSGLYCYVLTGSSTGRCVPFANDGSACQFGSNECVSGDVCVGTNTTAEAGVCMPAGVANSLCDVTNHTMATCNQTEGWECIPTPGSNTGSAILGMCQPAQLVGPGEQCGYLQGSSQYADCFAGTCAKGNPDICVGLAGDGEPCALLIDVGPPCLTPAVCVVGPDGMTGTCQIENPANCF